MKKISFTSFLLFGLIIGLSNISRGQSTGDYRSVATGNWTNLSAWEYFDGTVWVTPSGIAPQGYPGQFPGTEAVVIQSGHVVTLPNTGVNTQPMGSLTIASSGQLYLTGLNSAPVTFYLNTLLVNVIPTPTTGSIYFHLKVILSLPANAVINVTSNGLLGTCNSNVEIWIGGFVFASCAGAPGTIYTFGQVMAAGGTLNAIPTSNSPQCEGTTINLNGSYSGAFGTTTSGGSTTGVNYSWSVSGPGGYSANVNTQNTTIPTSALPGSYTASLSVSTYLATQLYTNTETITIIINPLPTLGTVVQDTEVCEGFPATINLDGLIANTTFTLTYSINGLAQTPVTGLISGPSGTSAFTTPVLTSLNNGQTLVVTGIAITSQSTGCSKVFTNNTLLTVNPETIGGAVTGESIICSGTSAFLTLSEYTGSVVLWQYSTDGVSWTDISNTNSTYTTPDLTTEAYFRATVKSGACATQNSTPILISLLENGNWYGNTSIDWNTEDNWCGGIPIITTDVIIPASSTFKPVIGTDDGVCNDLTITEGASLTINAGRSLTVDGILSNNAGNNGLVIKSDASGTGSLIHPTPDVDARVERYLTPDLWHYTSVPISDALSGMFMDIYLRTFDEQTYSWNPWIVPTDDPLEVMLGYAAWVPGDPMTVTFNGKLNTGNHSINVTRNNSLDNPGWNLIGNPYPSALDWNATAGWNKTSVNNTIYFYSGNGGLSNYKYYIGSGGETPEIGVNDGTNEIPAMQGFFVHASSDGSLSVNNNARIHSSQSYYKNDNAEIPFIRLQAEGNGLTDETVIRFFGGADLNFDGDFDALKLFGNGHPQIYSVTPDQTELAISTLPGYDEETVVPLGFMAASEGLHTISLTEFIAFESNSQIFLEDFVSGTIQKLSEESPYTFSSAPGDEYNRFLLHFSNPLGTSENMITPVSIYTHGNAVYVNMKEISNAEIFIHDLLGREIYKNNVTGENLVRIDLASKTGFCLVTVQSGNHIATQKVMIR